MRPFRRLSSLLLPVVVAGACGGSPGPAPMSAPPALAYAVPPGGAATYVQADTIDMDIDMGGQVVAVEVLMSSTLDLSYAGSGDAIDVTIDFRDFDITASNPLAGTQRGDEREIDGPLVFTIDRTGAGTLVTAPTVEGVAEQAVSPGAMAAAFFPRLPGRAVEAGEIWTDTVSIHTEDASGSTDGRTVYEFTAVGDTVVAGRTFLKVTFTTDDERRTSTSQMGADITQDVEGDGRGFYLWDADRNLVVEQFVEGRLGGVMEVSIAPAPLSIDMNVVQHLRLVEGG